jgi:citrate lyase beta subunit
MLLFSHKRRQRKLIRNGELIMKHFSYLTEDRKNAYFHKQPEEITKFTEREKLAYALGATLYSPSVNSIEEKLIQKSIPGLTSFVFCFEDAIREEEVEAGEENVRNMLQTIHQSIVDGKLKSEELPLLFIRVRNEVQFEKFVSSLTKDQAELLTGFNIPKLNSGNSNEYLGLTKQFASRFNTTFYAMPILESPEIIYKETRMDELLALRSSFLHHRDYILNVRVGGTDFSSLFGLRRGIDHTIYDIMVVADALRDIQNFLMRAEDGFVISAPVWEYFSNQRVLKPKLRETPFRAKDKMDKRREILGDALDGLINEITKDKANGFVGKTVIHPTHIPYVNALQCVTHEEYNDACMILNAKGGGVLKSSNGNKMNEFNPHRPWAKKIINKASVYGVLKEENDYVDLF